MKNCLLIVMLSLLSGISLAQCTTGTPGTIVRTIERAAADGNNTQSAITLVDLGLPALAPAAGQYTLSIASGMLVESDNGNNYHSLVGPQGPQGATGPTGPQGTTGAQGRSVRPERSDQLVRQGRREPQGRLERLDRRARSDRLGRQERRARRERQGLQERLDRLGRRERRERWVHKARSERSAGKEQRERRGHWAARSAGNDGAVGRVGRKERRARQEQRERSDLRDPPECKVQLVHRGHQELQPLVRLQFLLWDRVQSQCGRS